jgi:hypothetical protein
MPENEQAKAVESKPETKPTIVHGTPHPQADPLVAVLYRLITANPTNPSNVLQWLSTQPADIVRIALLRSQTAPWSIASELLVSSLSDDQARGVLACIIVGVYQGRATAQKAK